MKAPRKQKNKQKLSMSDIRPNKDPIIFDDFEKKNNTKSIAFEDNELSLVEALIEQEKLEILESERQVLFKKREEEQTRRSSSQFRNVHLDQYFLNNQIPTRIILDKQDDKFKNSIEKENQYTDFFELEQIELEESVFRQKQKESKLRERIKAEVGREKELLRNKKREFVKLKRLERKKRRIETIDKIKKNLLAKPVRIKENFSFIKPALAFSSICFVVFIAVFSLRFVSYGLQVKEQVIVKGANVVADLDQIKENFQDKDFSQIVLDFKNIQNEINYINLDLEKMEGGLPDIVSRIPFLSRYGSAKKALEAGNEISKAMVLLSQLMEEFSQMGNPLSSEGIGENVSLGVFFVNLEDQLLLAEKHCRLAQEKLEEVDSDDLPEKYQEKVDALKENFPKILNLLEKFNQKQIIFKDLLGYNGPRRYLFLFQNNHELRATGGFIGSYGVLTVHNGNVKEFFVDGIFNPDGQLSTRVVPPKPIQKISTNWSTHDANWFPDFPTSAEKIAWFYEKTGGPTVDGIITLTPTVMEELLEITGPIEMPEYDATVDSNNFIEATQFEVEVDYDKEENRPKKFIADLTPKILDRIFSKEGLSEFPKSLKIISEALTEKQILIYLENSEIQKFVSDLGWSGEVLPASRDYLMVVNSNINGYKTDGVIDQKIKHEIEIESDGSIIDTVIIERAHNGGSSEYEWWNKVNANYMRVYVPQGSELLEATGYTRETNESPIDYDKLGFVRDELVEDLERSIKIDDKSGTEIWDESGKTVFANWVYVSPQESVKVSYKYKLPFKIDVRKEQQKKDLFSVLYQKQSGMNTSGLETELLIPSGQSIFWQYPDSIKDKNGVLSYTKNLERDRFIGIVIK